MSRTPDEYDQPEMFDEDGNEQEHEKVNEHLSRLYKKGLITRDGKMRKLDLAYDAIDDGVWPMLPQREANARLRAPSCGRWMTRLNEAGVQNAYKTTDGYRKPIDQCTIEDIDHDLIEDVKQSAFDIKKIRQKIITRLFRFGEQDFPMDQIPRTHWTPADMEWFRSIRRRGDEMTAAAD